MADSASMIEANEPRRIVSPEYLKSLSEVDFKAEIGI
jgi:hypothetical protein